MILYTEMDINNVLDKFGWEGRRTRIEDISKSLLEFELGEVSYDIPYYGLDRELSLYFRQKLDKLAKEFNYPVNKETMLILLVENDLDNNLNVILDQFQQKYKDMDNICLVFDKKRGLLILFFLFLNFIKII